MVIGFGAITRIRRLWAILKRVGNSQHQSCLVVSGLEKPREIGPLESSTGFARSLQLTGLEDRSTKNIAEKKV